MRAISSLQPDTSFHGVGGAKMQAAGNTRDWLERSAVMGIVEVLKQYSWFKEQLEQMLEEIAHIQPDALVPIDYPKFNLTLAERVRKAGIPTKIIYYISPKVWAWNKGRVPKMAQLLDKMICIFPFEVEIYQQHGLPAVYVGNPLVDELGPIGSDQGRDRSLIGLFPGSREREVAKLFPLMVDAATRAPAPQAPAFRSSRRYPQAGPTNASDAQGNEHAKGKYHYHSSGRQPRADATAHAGVIASGTATLEAAWLGLPYCLVYKVALPTYMLGKLVVKIEHIGLVNILAGEGLVEEFIQGDADPCNIERALELFIKDKTPRAVLQQRLLATAATLGEPGVHHRAAQEVLNELAKG